MPEPKGVQLSKAARDPQLASQQVSNKQSVEFISCTLRMRDCCHYKGHKRKTRIFFHSPAHTLCATSNTYSNFNDIIIMKKTYNNNNNRNSDKNAITFKCTALLSCNILLQLRCNRPASHLASANPTAPAHISPLPLSGWLAGLLGWPICLPAYLVCILRLLKFNYGCIAFTFLLFFLMLCFYFFHCGNNFATHTVITAAVATDIRMHLHISACGQDKSVKLNKHNK